MLLSDFAKGNEVARDSESSRLGYFFTSGTKLLVFAQSRHFLIRAVGNPAVSGIVTAPEFLAEVPEHIGVLVSSEPRNRFFEIHESIAQAMPAPEFQINEPEDSYIHPTAFVHPAARIGRGVHIGEFSVVRARVTIGDEVTVEPGVKLGVDGILHRRVNGRQRLIPHIGRVRVGDGATLMTNSVIVSSIFKEDHTSLGDGTVLGMNAIVGHEATVGSNCVISNGVTLARNSYIGDETFIGTGAIVREYVRVGHGARLLAGSVVIADVEANESVSGNFAADHNVLLREFVRMNSKRHGRWDQGHDRP